MAGKENKGGTLTNEQVEQDNRVKGKVEEGGRTYIGSQDTGDSTIREMGTDVQRADGAPADSEEELDDK